MSVVSIRSEEILWCIHVESEWQEYLNIRSFGQDGGVDMPGVLQLVNADGVIALFIAASVQWIQNLPGTQRKHISTIKIHQTTKMS